MNQLKQRYQQEVIPQLKTEFGIANPFQIPKLEKIVVNIGLGRASGDKKIIEAATNTLRKITGQQPVPTLAKHSIAAFKLRAGQPIGLMVTLRGERMYEFLERLIGVVFPRMRDFHGLNRKSFDGSANFSLGMSDQTVFPELSYEDTTTGHGLQITIVTSSDNLEHSQRLLELLGLPLERSQTRA